MNRKIRKIILKWRLRRMSVLLGLIFIIGANIIFWRLVLLGIGNIKRKISDFRLNTNIKRQFDLFYFKFTIPEFNPIVYDWSQNLLNELYCIEKRSDYNSGFSSYNFSVNSSTPNFLNYINSSLSIFPRKFFSFESGKKNMEQVLNNSIIIGDDDLTYFNEINFYKFFASTIDRADPDELMINCLKNSKNLVDPIADCTEKIRSLDGKRYELECKWRKSKHDFTSSQKNSLKKEVELIDHKIKALKEKLPNIKITKKKELSKNASIDEQYLYECLSSDGFIELNDLSIKQIAERIINLLKEDGTRSRYYQVPISYESLTENSFISGLRNQEYTRTIPAGYYSDGNGNLIYNKERIEYEKYIDRYEIEL